MSRLPVPPVSPKIPASKDTGELVDRLAQHWVEHGRFDSSTGSPDRGNWDHIKTSKPFAERAARLTAKWAISALADVGFVPLSALTSLRAERDAAEADGDRMLNAERQAHIETSNQALALAFQLRAAESSLAAEKLKVADLTAAAEHQMHHSEVVRANAAALEQRVAALVGALNHVHNWIANADFDAHQIHEAVAIDEIVLAAINPVDASFVAATEA